MLLKALLWLVALVYQSPEGEYQTSPPHEFRPTAQGPQSPEEAAIANRALHGEHFGGDIILPNNRIGRAGDKDTKYRWHGYPGSGTIPYIIDPSLDYIKPLIHKAIEEFSKVSCIRWVERKNETDYVRLFSGAGCWSYLGMNGGHQDLSLGPGCGYIGLVIHEMAHAIGLHHEHQRSDRDDHVKIFEQNIAPGQEHNFVKTDPNLEVIFTPYDYDSIMHYGNYAFSKDSWRLMTMEAKNGHQLVEPYDKAGMMQTDVHTINKLYKCPST